MAMGAAAATTYRSFLPKEKLYAKKTNSYNVCIIIIVTVCPGKEFGQKGKKNYLSFYANKAALDV